MIVHNFEIVDCIPWTERDFFNILHNNSTSIYIGNIYWLRQTHLFFSLMFFFFMCSSLFPSCKSYSYLFFYCKITIDRKKKENFGKTNIAKFYIYFSLSEIRNLPDHSSSLTHLRSRSISTITQMGFFFQSAHNHHQNIPETKVLHTFGENNTLFLYNCLLF